MRAKPSASTRTARLCEDPKRSKRDEIFLTKRVLRLITLKNLTNTLNAGLMIVCSAALLSMALVMAAVVLLRYVFGTGALWFQDLALYAHAAVVLLPAGAVLALNRHVRVDVLMSNSSARMRAIVDLLGGVFFLCPFCLVLMIGCSTIKLKNFS